MKIIHHTGAVALLALSLAGCSDQAPNSPSGMASEKAAGEPVDELFSKQGPLLQSPDDARTYQQKRLSGIREATKPLAHALSVFKKMQDQNALVLSSGVKPDLAPLEQSLAAVKEQIAEAERNTREAFSSQDFDRLFDQILTLEQQVSWPDGSPEKRAVAGDIVAASDEFDKGQ